MRELCFVPLTDGRIAIGAVGVRTADGGLQPLIPHNAKVPAEGSILLTSATKSQNILSAELAVGSPRTVVGRLALDLDEDAPRGCPQARLHVQIDHLGALRANLTAMETSTSSLLHADGECDPVRWAAPPTARTLPRPWRYTACRSTEPLAGVAVGASFVRLVGQRAARPPGEAVPKGADDEVAPAFTASRLWPASVSLALGLERAAVRGAPWWAPRLLAPRARILELGAGVGLAGLAAALVAAPDAEVALTDLPENLGLLRQNVDANGLGGRVRVDALDWTAPLPAAFASAPWDLVLGADVVHWEGLFAPLTRTITALIGGSGVALLRLGHRRGAAQSFGRRLRDGDGSLGDLPPPRSKAFLASAASVLDCVMQEEEEDSETTSLYVCRAKAPRDEL